MKMDLSISDFDWLKANQPSPNWSFMNEEMMLKWPFISKLPDE